MSKSKSNFNRCRLHIYFDQGLASTLACDLLALLAQAGFELRCSLAPGAEHWLPPEPIHLLTGHRPLPFGQAPMWPGGGKADLGIAVLASVASWSKAVAFHQQWRNFTAGGHVGILSEVPWLLITSSAEQPNAAIISRGPPIIGIITLPPVIGSWNQAFQNVFARITRYLRARADPNVLGKRVTILHTVPAELAAVSDRIPAWVYELRLFFSLAGAQLDLHSPEDADILILTYGGPFIVKPNDTKPVRRKKNAAETLRLSFEAEHAPLPLCRGLTVIFFTSATPAIDIAALANSKGNKFQILPIMRDADGNLTLFPPGEPPRILPNLTDQPALERLVEYLLDLPLPSNAN